jgi:hypothetical protein
MIKWDAVMSGLRADGNCCMIHTPSPNLSRRERGRRGAAKVGRGWAGAKQNSRDPF